MGVHENWLYRSSTPAKWIKTAYFHVENDVTLRYSGGLFPSPYVPYRIHIDIRRDPFQDFPGIPVTSELIAILNTEARDGAP